MPKHSDRKPKAGYIVIRSGRKMLRIRRTPHMEFPAEATPHQKRQIQGCLSMLETDYNGLEKLNLERVRAFGAPYKNAPFLGNPQWGYLLVKAWLRAMEARGAIIPGFWYDVIREPNKYLNPTNYLDDDYYFALVGAWNDPMPMRSFDVTNTFLLGGHDAT